MKPWFEVKQLEDDLYLIKENQHWEETNMYYIIGDCFNVLIDSGTGIKPIKSLLKHIDDKPIKVLTTHVHWDHIGNHSEFEDIYVHKLASLWLEKGIPLDKTYVYHQMIKDVPGIYLKDIPDLDVFNVFTASNYKVLDHGDCLDLGNKTLRVIHTPGHSPGHIVLYDMGLKRLFTGDLCYKGLIYCNYPSTDPEALFNSFMAIHALDILTVYPGHGESPMDSSIIDDGYVCLSKCDEANQLYHGSGLYKGEKISFIF